MKLWAVVRPVLILVIGVFVIHTIGRWEGRIDQRERDHDRQYNAFRSTAVAYSELRDAMVLLEDSLRRVDSALAELEHRDVEVLASLDSTDVAESESVTVAPLADLLPPLRLRFYHTEDGSHYGTDSSGVRFLAGRMLLLRQRARRIATLERLAATRLSRISVLSESSATASARANTAEARLASSESIAAECESLRRRQGKWLGFIPKPPRIIVFVVGVGAGYLIQSQ